MEGNLKTVEVKCQDVTGKVCTEGGQKLTFNFLRNVATQKTSFSFDWVMLYHRVDL